MKNVHLVSTKQHEDMKSGNPFWIANRLISCPHVAQPSRKLGVLARTCKSPTLPSDT